MAVIACARCNRMGHTTDMRKTYVGVYVCQPKCERQQTPAQTSVASSEAVRPPGQPSDQQMPEAIAKGLSFLEKF